MEKQGASQVWAEVTALARLPGVLDLGQGWPEMGASELARAAASEAMLSDEHSNQYSPSPGAPELVNAIERYYRATGSLPDDSVEREVLVTTSATEALYVTLQALCDPGDEVVFLEPFFPWYKSHARIFGATPRTVRLREEGVAPNKRFRLRLDDLRDAFVAGAGKTKAFIHCNPHNPTGLMFSETETKEIARLCAEFDVVIVADEVYERCTFDEETPMTRMADVDVAASDTEPGIATRARTLVVGTASKLLCLSGWRVGWVVGPKPLIAALKTIHAYSTFCAPTPLQLGVAAALEKMADDADAATRARATESASRSPTTTDGTSHDVSGRREAAFACTRGCLVPDAVAEIIASNVAVMSRALTDSGVAPFAPSGGYFLVADVSDTGLDATEYCFALATGPARVAAVPMDVFFDAEGPAKDVPRNLVRFAVCKSSETIGKCAEAIRNNPVGAARK